MSTTPSVLQLPKFEPLPPTNFVNRLINRTLAPVFYLIYTILLSVIVVPIWTIVQNFKNGRNSKGGQRVPSDDSEGPTQAADFLNRYSGSYGRKRHGHHETHVQTQGQHGEQGLGQSTAHESAQKTLDPNTRL